MHTNNDRQTDSLLIIVNYDIVAVSRLFLPQIIDARITTNRGIKPRLTICQP